jgi:hypothetical protein
MARGASELAVVLLAIWYVGTIEPVHEHYCCYASNFTWKTVHLGLCTDPDAPINQGKHAGDRVACTLGHQRMLTTVSQVLLGASGLVLVVFLAVDVLVYMRPAASSATVTEATGAAARRQSLRAQATRAPAQHAHCDYMIGARPLEHLARVYMWSPLGALMGSGLTADPRPTSTEHAVHCSLGVAAVAGGVSTALWLTPGTTWWWVAAMSSAVTAVAVYLNNVAHWIEFVVRAHRAHRAHKLDPAAHEDASDYQARAAATLNTSIRQRSH